MNLPGLSSVSGVLDEFLNDIKKARARRKEDKERLLVEWQNTKNMPRKMKKRRRKEILVDWAVAGYDALDGVSDEYLEGCVALFKNLTDC